MPGTVILHFETDDVIPIPDSLELVQNSGLPESALVVVGTDHRLADTERGGSVSDLARRVCCCATALLLITSRFWKH